MEYITFMHNNRDTLPSEREWEDFFVKAKESGMFQGGSAIGRRSIVGSKQVPDSTINIVGYMKFESTSLDLLEELLSHHPVVKHGGTIEVCELPKT